MLESLWTFIYFFAFFCVFSPKQFLPLKMSVKKPFQKFILRDTDKINYCKIFHCQFCCNRIQAILPSDFHRIVSILKSVLFQHTNRYGFYIFILPAFCISLQVQQLTCFSTLQRFHCCRCRTFPCFDFY